MRLLIAAVGKLKQGPERELYARYLARAEALGRSLSLAPLIGIELSESRADTAGARQAAESEALLAKIPQGHALVCFDSEGKMESSEAFAAMLSGLRDKGAPGAAFVIGGPDGLGRDVRGKADRILSLGPMTLPHGLARIILAEQLYRAMTILTGHPYHRS